MAWSARQLAMLRAMGLRTWQRPAQVTVDAQTPDSALTAEPVQTVPPVRAEHAVPAGHSRQRVHGAPPAPTAAPTPAGAASAATQQLRPPEQAGRAPAPVLAPAEAVGHPGRPATPMALDWAALREAVDGCRDCALSATRRQAVFGAGHPQAHWMVVGEAPGAEEDQQGDPFAGPAGQLLDNMLRALALTRAAAVQPEHAVFVANVLKCRAPEDRNPTADEVARCAPYLQRQLALVQPRVILAMGALAIRALLRTGDAVGQLRGRVHRCQGAPVVVTYHPRHLLRTPALKARAWDDLCLAASVVEGADAAHRA